jgi:hypothetical protein
VVGCSGGLRGHGYFNGFVNISVIVEGLMRVIEYGDDWRLENIFRDMRAAKEYADRISKASWHPYVRIAPNKWYCKIKDSYIEIKL